MAPFANVAFATERPDLIQSWGMEIFISAGYGIQGIIGIGLPVYPIITVILMCLRLASRIHMGICELRASTHDTSIHR